MPFIERSSQATYASALRELMEIKETFMAKVIEFYIPKNFRSPHKWAPELQLGKVLEFRAPAQKSA